MRCSKRCKLSRRETASWLVLSDVSCWLAVFSRDPFLFHNQVHCFIHGASEQEVEKVLYVFHGAFRRRYGDGLRAVHFVIYTVTDASAKLYIL